MSASWKRWHYAELVCLKHYAEKVKGGMTQYQAIRALEQNELKGRSWESIRSKLKKYLKEKT